MIIKKKGKRLSFTICQRAKLGGRQRLSGIKNGLRPSQPKSSVTGGNIKHEHVAF